MIFRIAINSLSPTSGCQGCKVLLHTLLMMYHYLICLSSATIIALYLKLSIMYKAKQQVRQKCKSIITLFCQSISSCVNACFTLFLLSTEHLPNEVRVGKPGPQPGGDKKLVTIIHDTGIGNLAPLKYFSPPKAFLLVAGQGQTGYYIFSIIFLFNRTTYDLRFHRLNFYADYIDTNVNATRRNCLTKLNCLEFFL